MLVAAVLAVGFLAQAEPASAAPPNVVVVMTDDQEVRSVNEMPTVERQLVDKGTEFTNFFATLPLCCPSRATFLTGQYAHNHGVTLNTPGFRAFEDSGTLPVSLRRAGYRTSFIGKYLNHYGRFATQNPDYIPPGWSDWHAAVTAGSMFGFSLDENGRIREYTGRRNYQTDVYARKATSFIRESSRSPKPFFLTVSTLAPHGEPQRSGPSPRPAPRHRGAFSNAPLPKPPSFNEADVSDKPASVQAAPRLGRAEKQALKEKYRARLASLLAVDDAVGSIVGELRRTGELRNTLIAFTSDNGYLLGEHRLQAKLELYEEAAKVPLIVRGPGVPAGERRSQVTGNVDLAPTIIDMAGAAPQRVMDGRSLTPLIADSTLEPDRDILLEIPNGAKGAVRTSRYMYAEHPREQRELYDLVNDPFELESIHVGGPHETPESADLELRMERRLRQLENCAGAGCR